MYKLTIDKLSDNKQKIDYSINDDHKYISAICLEPIFLYMLNKDKMTLNDPNKLLDILFEKYGNLIDEGIRRFSERDRFNNSFRHIIDEFPDLSL